MRYRQEVSWWKNGDWSRISLEGYRYPFGAFIARVLPNRWKAFHARSGEPMHERSFPTKTQAFNYAWKINQVIGQYGVSLHFTLKELTDAVPYDFSKINMEIAKENRLLSY